MATQQPDWRFVANLGDVNPVEHGGCFVFEDATGQYPPEMEVWENNLDYKEEDTPGEWTVFRFCLERCTYVDGVLSDNEFHREHEVWFADCVESVADFAGWEKEVLIEALCSDDARKRGVAYLDLTLYYGITSFDDTPFSLTEDEVRERAAKYEHMERCARVGLSPDTPEGIVRDRMLDLGLIRE